MKNIILKYFPELAGLIVFLVYLRTMCPTIMGMDSGELATVQATLSIAHPTGYPLFAWVGYLFLKLPLPFETIIRLNILAAIWCTLTVIVLIRTNRIIVENVSELVTDKWKTLVINIKNNYYSVLLSSIYSGLMFAFSLTFWLQSTHVEVYSLQMFLLSLIIYLSIKAHIDKEQVNFFPIGEWYKKRWFWVFILIGIAFANHLTTVYIILPTIVLFFLNHKFDVKNIRAIIFFFFISFFIAMIFYLWMMFRAASNPAFKYGDPSNLQRLLEHITAKRYTQNLFNGTSPIKIQFIKFIDSLQFNFSENKWGEFSFSIFMGFAGLIFSGIISKKILSYLFLIVTITLVISLNYYVFDIYEYFLPAFYVLSLAACFSVLLITLIIPSKKTAKVLLFTFLSLLIGSQIYANYKFVDKSDERSYEDFAKKYIESLPPNAVLYTDNWDKMLSPILYLQNVKQIRRDILVFSPWRRICFTPYQSSNTKRFFKADKLIIDDKTFIFDSLNLNYVELGE